MSILEAVGDVFGNFEGQNDAESATLFPPIISTEPIRRPPSLSSSLTAQPPPCNNVPRSFVEASPDLERAA